MEMAKIVIIDVERREWRAQGEREKECIETEREREEERSVGLLPFGEADRNARCPR